MRRRRRGSRRRRGTHHVVEEGLDETLGGSGRAAALALVAPYRVERVDSAGSITVDTSDCGFLELGMSGGVRGWDGKGRTNHVCVVGEEALAVEHGLDHAGNGGEGGDARVGVVVPLRRGRQGEGQRVVGTAGWVERGAFERARSPSVTALDQHFVWYAGVVSLPLMSVPSSSLPRRRLPAGPSSPTWPLMIPS